METSKRSRGVPSSQGSVSRFYVPFRQEDKGVHGDPPPNNTPSEHDLNLEKVVRGSLDGEVKKEKLQRSFVHQGGDHHLRTYKNGW